METCWPITGVICCYSTVDLSFILRRNHESVGGIMVSIAAFQAVDPGSIPGRRIYVRFFAAFCV